jgi:putative transposase
MSQSFISMHCHLVFSTKNREPTIDRILQPRLLEYIGGIIARQDGVLLAAGGMPDHVHLLVSFAKEMSTSDLVRDVKANSSGWIHKGFPDKKSFAWQTGYGAFSVSYSNIPEVDAYIANQEDHHRVRTFKEEFLAFLARHNLKWDERYVWD